MNKSLIIYYSRTGSNYVSGNIVDLKIGNTEVIANFIKNLTGADIFKVEPKIEYSKDYTECTEQSKVEVRDNARPEVKSYIESIDQYDNIFVGYPNWWGTMPMFMFTFLERYDFTNKKVIPFCTHEGSGMGKSEKDIKIICKGADVVNGLALRGGSVSSSEQNVENYLKSINFKC